MPWKNGGGVTTEIAVFPEDASLGDFEWRVSTAHVGTDGPFSSFPGIDRTLAVLNGGGIRLAFAEGEAVMLDRGSQPFAFDADRAVTGELPAGTIDDLNVMSRRGRWSHRVERLAGTQPRKVEAERGLLLLFAPEGGWRADGQHLDRHDSLLIRVPASIACVPDEAAGPLFSIRLIPAV